MDWGGLLLLGVASLLLVYALCAIQAFVAWGLIVKVDSMVKNVGETIVVSVTPVPAEAVVTDLVYFADPAIFAPTADANIFTCLIPTTGASIRVEGKAVDGSTVTGTSEAIDVAGPVVATALVVSVA